jgi:hypothetical protein
VACSRSRPPPPFKVLHLRLTSRLILLENETSHRIQTQLYRPLIPSFVFVVNAFSICTRLTNVRLTRAHHWLSQACLPPPLRPFRRAPPAFGQEGPPFRRTRRSFHSLTSSPKLHVLAFDHLTSLDIFSPPNIYAVTLRASSHAPHSSYMSPDRILGSGLRFLLVRKLTPSHFLSVHG